MIIIQTPEKGFIREWPDGDPEALRLAEEPRDAFPELTAEWLAGWDETEPTF